MPNQGSCSDVCYGCSVWTIPSASWLRSLKNSRATHRLGTGSRTFRNCSTACRDKRHPLLDRSSVSWQRLIRKRYTAICEQLGKIWWCSRRITNNNKQRRRRPRPSKPKALQLRSRDLRILDLALAAMQPMEIASLLLMGPPVAPSRQRVVNKAAQAATPPLLIRLPPPRSLGITWRRSVPSSRRLSLSLLSPWRRCSTRSRRTSSARQTKMLTDS
jgi:hypothetical protein